MKRKSNVGHWLKFCVVHDQERTVMSSRSQEREKMVAGQVKLGTPVSELLVLPLR